jgi:DNA-binding transcriptional LysR family regulator
MNEMKLDWADLKLFLAVARGGGLAGGAQLTGVSAPTLGRHMAELERCVGDVLFLRQARGYDLTTAGHTLFAEAQEVELSVQAIEHRLSNRERMLPITISAGTWMTCFLTQQIDKIARPEARLVFTPDEAQKNIARREATIGLRNSRPTDPSVFLRKTTRVAFAPYATVVGRRADRWIALNLTTPSAQWVKAHRADQIILEASHPRTLLDLALQDMGQVILPCFIGDTQPKLERSGDIIPALTHDQWLVVHGQDRAYKTTRDTVDRIVSLIKSQRRLFEGTGH